MEEKITGLIVRDPDGKLIVLKHPTLGRGKYSWVTADDVISDKDNVQAVLHHSFFPQVKWEDDEPTEVELTIKIK